MALACEKALPERGHFLPDTMAAMRKNWCDERFSLLLWLYPMPSHIMRQMRSAEGAWLRGINPGKACF
jgi:hypothetical protein